MIFDFLGDEKQYFMKSSWQVYTDLSGSLQYVGKTSNEKTFNPSLELAEWYDNSSGTQSLYVLDIDKFDFNVSFQFMQVLDPNVIAAAWNFEPDDSDPDYTFLYQGSDPDSLHEAEWRFVGQGRTGLEIVLVIRKGICVPNGEWTVGTPGQYSGLGVTVRAIQDTTVTDKSRDMVYFRMAKKPLS